MAYNPDQFRSLITRTLSEVNLYSPAAVNLLLGTAAQESAFGTYLRQVKGPALGAFQMEKVTFLDLRKRMSAVVPEICCWNFARLEWDLRAAIIMARLKYRSIQEPLPDVDDVLALGYYWKQWYNTPLGAGTIPQFVKSYNLYVSGSLS